MQKKMLLNYLRAFFYSFGNVFFEKIGKVIIFSTLFSQRYFLNIIFLVQSLPIFATKTPLR